MTSNNRIFITGAAGYIGSLITEYAIAKGYSVHGLARTEKSDAKLLSLGATPVRGDLTSLDVLKKECAEASIAIYLANYIEIMDQDKLTQVNIAAIDAMVEGLRPGTMLIDASGSLVVKADPDGAETTESSPLPVDPLNKRILREQYLLARASKGIRTCAVRLAPFVYGNGGSGVYNLMSRFMAAGEAVYIGDGAIRTTTVHVEDAARLFLLVAEKGKSGQVYNGTFETDVTFRALTEAIASVLGIPARSEPLESFQAANGLFSTMFLTSENRASNAKAVKELGWEIKCKPILDDITSGSYLEVAEKLKKNSRA